jgi:hypothetical protein
MTQGTIHSSVYINIQEGKVAIQLSLCGEYDIEMHIVEVVKEAI